MWLNTLIRLDERPAQSLSYNSLVLVDDNLEIKGMCYKLNSNNKKEKEDYDSELNWTENSHLDSRVEKLHKVHRSLENMEE